MAEPTEPTEIDSKEKGLQEAPGAADENAVRKPNASKFHQQKLPAWQPLLTAGAVFPLFFAIGAVFIPIGAVLFTSSESLHEAAYNYTNCRDRNNLYCMELISKPDYYLHHRSCQCNVSVQLKSNFSGQVYAYYGLTNFYQNHRRYVKSRDDKQLMGGRSANLLEDCAPYRHDAATGKWLAPCGAIANSLFNDSFQLFYNRPGGGQLLVPWTSRGIAWVTDRERKFAKVANWNGTTKPASWRLSAQQRSADSYRGDEELLVWMRTAALPTFRKLHRIVQHDANDSAAELFRSGLPAGDYTLSVSYAFPVSAFAGTKSFILTTSGWTGGKNPALGILYMAVGCLHVVLGIVFTVVHVHASKNSVVSLNYPAPGAGAAAAGMDAVAAERTVSASALVMNDELALEAGAEQPATGYDGVGFETSVGRRDEAGEETQMKPRNMLQTLTLADY